jgi:epoxyqueuosine reductase
MKSAIQQRAQELGFDACRITTATPPDHADAFSQWVADSKYGEMGWIARNAHKRVDPQQVLSGAKSIVTLAVSYFSENADTGGNRMKQGHAGESVFSDSGERVVGITARYAQFADYHNVLADKLKALSDYIDELGGPETRSLWYVDTGPFLERDLAQRAGLGFVGKHTNLISRSLGNWFFLAEIITTAPLAPDEPEKNRCGSCSRCISACPTAAITAPFELDARRCISYLTIELKGSIPVELRPLIGTRIYGCDDCLAACPWNRFAREGSLMKAHSRADLDTPDLIELLSLDDAAFKKRFAGTPMVRTKRRGILRNVCVALGNVGCESALPALEKAATDPEPLIAEHARWAIDAIRSKTRV